MRCHHPVKGGTAAGDAPRSGAVDGRSRLELQETGLRDAQGEDQADGRKVSAKAKTRARAMGS